MLVKFYEVVVRLIVVTFSSYNVSDGVQLCVWRGEGGANSPANKKTIGDVNFFLIFTFNLDLSKMSEVLG